MCNTGPYVGPVIELILSLSFVQATSNLCWWHCFLLVEERQLEQYPSLPRSPAQKFHGWAFEVGTTLVHLTDYLLDIAKMNDSLDGAREGCTLIENTLKRKQLSVNYDKSKFIL